MPPYGACLLGSINLAKLVTNPFEAECANSIWKRWRELTRTAVRLLDDVIDISRFPLEAQRAEAFAKRRIGLGVTGLADALIFCRTQYGSPESVGADRKLAGDAEPCRLSRLGGSGARKRRVSAVRPRRISGAAIHRRAARGHPRADRRHGIRNGLLTSIAPTGTISLFAGNVSSGIEPVFAYNYGRRVLLPDGSRSEETVSDYAVDAFRARFGDETALPDYFVSAQSLAPGRPSGGPGGGAEIYRQLDFQDHQRAGHDFLRGLQGHLCARLRTRLQGLHHLSPQRGDRRGAGPKPPAATAQRRAAAAAWTCRAPREAGGIVYMTKPLDRPGRADRPDLQDQMARTPTTPSTSPSTTWRRTAAAGPSRSSSTPRTWKPMPGRWR